MTPRDATIAVASGLVLGYLAACFVTVDVYNDIDVSADVCDAMAPPPDAAGCSGEIGCSGPTDLCVCGYCRAVAP